MDPDLATHFTTLDNFGHSLRAMAYRLRAETAEEVRAVFSLAERSSLTVTVRGAGRSYNDASLNGGQIVLDLSRMNRILEWVPGTGLIRCEPGVTLEQLWTCVEPDGWWPPVVSGTMRTTLGGCLAANIHGKNNFQAGPIGEHVEEFTAWLPNGTEVTCSRDQNADLFYAMLGGFGMLGTFLSITLQMKRMHSGMLAVDAWPVQDLKRHLGALHEHAPAYDYIVGWLDTTVTGAALGRGQIHAARYLQPGDDPHPERTRRIEKQVLPARILGVFPRSSLHLLMRPFANDLGWRMVNAAKYFSALRRHSFRQAHAAFHFLLDYVPNWERSYGRGGLIQHQSFLPTETAEDAWRQILRLSHARGLPSYLGVTKRHRPDAFLLTHAVDGFSLALDFKVTDRNRRKLGMLLQDFDRIVLDAGGRFYFAKNSETSPETARRFLGGETIARFRALKQRCDPKNLLESDLYRRVLSANDVD
jgi:FAD/FMN-containing dehydrogenase